MKHAIRSLLLSAPLLAIASAAIASAALLTSCGTGKVGDGVRPKDITANQALGTPATACSGEPKYAKPYVVDLDPSIRTDLEAAMKRKEKGVVVVAYDCASLRVLPSCKQAEGSYEYVGVQPKEKSVQVKNQDDLSATLPFSSGKIGGELSSGRSIDLALVLVGKKSTAVEKVRRDELTGECEGATHFIQSAELGAFSMATGSVGKVRAAAEVFSVGASGSSESSRSALNKDGSIDACQKADSDSPKPPANCGGPLTVQLLPLKGAPKPDEKPEKSADKNAPKPVENPCREGYLYADGVCTKATEPAHLCKPREIDDCLAQCEKGSAESCFNYAAYVGHDFSIRKKYSKKACDGGFPDGCGDYAIFDKLEPEVKNDPPKSPRRMAGLKVAQQGCDAGGGKSCFITGLLLWGYDDDSLKDLPGGKRAWERSCNLGNGEGCYRLSSLYEFGTSDDRVPKDMKKAIAYQERACENDPYMQCNRLGQLLIEAEPPSRDVDRAVQVLTKRCKVHAILDCNQEIELMTKAGRLPEAFAAAKSICDREVFACDTLGEMYAEGKGTAKDMAKAREAWIRGCDGGNGDKSSCGKLNAPPAPTPKAAPKGGGKKPAPPKTPKTPKKK